MSSAHSPNQVLPGPGTVTLIKLFFGFFLFFICFCYLARLPAVLTPLDRHCSLTDGLRCHLINFFYPLP